MENTVHFVPLIRPHKVQYIVSKFSVIKLFHYMIANKNRYKRYITFVATLYIETKNPIKIIATILSDCIYTHNSTDAALWLLHENSHFVKHDSGQ